MSLLAAFHMYCDAHLWTSVPVGLLLGAGIGQWAEWFVARRRRADGVRG